MNDAMMAAWLENFIEDGPETISSRDQLILFQILARLRDFQQASLREFQSGITDHTNGSKA